MIQRKLDKKIDEEINVKIDQEVKKFDQRIEEEINKDIENEIASTIKNRVREKIEEAVQNNQNERLKTKVKKGISSLWWKGGQQVFLINSITYIVVFTIMFLCLIPVPGLCLARGLLGAGPLLALIATIALAISIFVSVVYLRSRPALIFSIILSIPLVIIVALLL
jgi:hypothetical protein